MKVRLYSGVLLKASLLRELSPVGFPIALTINVQLRYA